MFMVMSNELNTPKLLTCPSDSKQQASLFTTAAVVNDQVFRGDTNVSYFVGVDANETSPQMFLTGDRNLGTGPANNPTVLFSEGTTSRFQSLGTNLNTAPLSTLQWTDSIHQKQGNVGLSDGSVQGFSTSAMKQAAANTGDTGRGSYAPFTASGINRLQFPQ
jgi:hypothetical protein